MKQRQLGIVLAISALAALAGACGGKPHGSGHESAAAPAPPPPTPDTTPIEALRTPAGLVLKLDTTATPAPAPTATPSK